LNFQNDNVTTNASGLSGTRYYGTGFESSSSGYTAGGNNGSAGIETIDRLQFTNDTVASISAVIYSPVPYYLVAGFSSGSAGYACGGATPDSTISKLTFATETSATNVSSLTGTRAYGVAGFENV